MYNEAGICKLTTYKPHLVLQPDVMAKTFIGFFGLWRDMRLVLTELNSSQIQTLTSHCHSLGSFKQS